MKVSIIVCHPNQASFNHALAGAIRGSLEQAGHSVRLHDLHAEAFDPVYGPEEHKREAVLPPAIAAHVEELCEAEGLVIVHPNYWSRPPALLCGWVDRVFRAGRAYQFVPDGKGGARLQGLLKLRFAAVVVTANTPRDKELALYGDVLDLHWRKVVFGMVGLQRVELFPLSPVIVSTPEQRQQWLSEVPARISSLAAG